MADRLEAAMAPKVLVCDNEEALRDLVRGALELGDYEILKARDGDQSVELARKFQPGGAAPARRDAPRSGTGDRKASDGQAALDEITVRKPDAVVLDLMMPGVEGFEVLERLQDDPETRLLPVVVLTARTLSGEERSVLRERVVSLLEKSAYSGDELRSLITRALGEP